MTFGWFGGKTPRRWVRITGAGTVLFTVSLAGASFARAKPVEAPWVGSVGELPSADQQVLAEILRRVGVKSVKVRSVERSPERQVKVMLNSAIEDFERAKATYCDAGDEVLERFDPKATREKNQSVMLEALLAVLPRAREMGCLNHVRNADVISVDVDAKDVPERLHEPLMKAAEAAVVAKKLERFLAPPREPDAFHFEFKRRDDSANSAGSSARNVAAKNVPAGTAE